MNMEKLLKDYNLGYVHEYFNMIVESVSNGQPMQARDQFLAMPQQDRIRFLELLTESIFDESCEWPRPLAYSTAKKLIAVIY